MAQLVAEPSNPHDPQAIAVVLGEDIVGYISRESTYSVHPVLRAASAQGLPAICWASLTGGHITPTGDALSIGIMLHMGYPPTLLEDGHPPLPPGDRVSLTGEQHCQEFLAARLAADPFGHLIGQLGPTPEGRVGVWVDGQHLGVMTELMSKRHGPRLRKLAEQGFPITGYVSLDQGAKKVEAYVYVPMLPFE